jgi:rhomboid protease GluP
MDIFGSGYISYTLMFLSGVVSLFVWSHKEFFRYGMNRMYYMQWDYPNFLKQVGLFQFIHGDILHLVMNSYFLYSAGPTLERLLWESNFVIFFLTTTIISVFALYVFAPRSNTIGISGFCMAILAYLWIVLYMIGDPWASQIGTLLIINIAFWFAPGISFVGHAAGALSGVAFWYITHNIL